MSTSPHPEHGTADSDETAEDQMPHTPDQDGPHDVPDEQVIEKTLPNTPLPDRARSSR
jgi:hypothetical protein